VQYMASEGVQGTAHMSSPISCLSHAAWLGRELSGFELFMCDLHYINDGFAMQRCAAAKICLKLIGYCARSHQFSIARLCADRKA